MSTFDYTYLNLLRQVYSSNLQLQVGKFKVWRQYNVNFEIDLSEYTFENYHASSYRLPLVTTRAISYLHSVDETLWMLTGSKSIDDLGRAKGFWQPWADSQGNLDVSYGAQMVGHFSFNQLHAALEECVRGSNSRRAVVSLWEGESCFSSKQPPCHVGMHFIPENHKLHLAIHARAQCVINGLPYDALNYSLLLILAAQSIGFKVGKIFWHCDVLELYDVHKEEATKYLKHIEQLEANTRFSKALDIYFTDSDIQQIVKYPPSLISHNLRMYHLLSKANFAMIFEDDYLSVKFKFPLPVN